MPIILSLGIQTEIAHFGQMWYGSPDIAHSQLKDAGDARATYFTENVVQEMTVVLFNAEFSGMGSMQTRIQQLVFFTVQIIVFPFLHLVKPFLFYFLFWWFRNHVCVGEL